MKHISKYIKRDISCLTNSNDLIKLQKIINFPVFFGVTSEPIEEDLYAEMEWFIEEQTGLIQLNNLIPLDVLYQSQHAYGFGETWEKHYKHFSDFILNASPQNVLEIGAGQGKIAQICSNSDLIQKWTIVEPNPTFQPTDKIFVIKGFFDSQFNFEEDFDTYTFSHVLEHAYNPREFLECIYDKMSNNDNLIFSYPNLESWLKNKFTNSLNFEHTIFLTDNHLNTLLLDIGFKIIDKKNYEDHSHFYHVKKDIKPLNKLTFENLSNKHRVLLQDFIKYHEDEVFILNEKIKKFDSKKVFLFGAHIFSQYLKVFGLETKCINSILDNSKQKQGLRLYGTDLYVNSPDILNEIENPIVILRAGPYNEEIKNQILNTINAQTIFI